MDLATQILVIIVSVLLSLFLIVSITILVLVAKLIKEVKRVVTKVENLAEDASHIGDVLKDASGQFAAIKMIRNIIKLVKR